MALLQITETQAAYIASATHCPAPEEYWPEGVPAKDVEHAEMYSWGDKNEEEIEGYASSGWHVKELREAPYKFPEAELGWYVIFHPGGWSGSSIAVEGPFENWEDAAAAADLRGDRFHPRDDY